jgi:hypothetical protein
VRTREGENRGEEEEEERRKRAVFPLPNQTRELEREVSCVFSAQTRPEIRDKGRRRESKRKRGLGRERAAISEREPGAREREGLFPAMDSGVSGKPATQTPLVFVPSAVFAR